MAGFCEKRWQLRRKSSKLSRLSLQFISKYSKSFQQYASRRTPGEASRAYLQKAEFASLEELAQNVGASISTVRRDLAALEVGKLVRRTHGGARSLQPPKSDEFVFNVRDTHQVAEKESLGEACAALIQPGQNVIIDSGTTCFHVAKRLGDKVAQIITNSLPVANLFSGSNRHEVHLSGGVIYPRLGTLVGRTRSTRFRECTPMSRSERRGITADGIYNRTRSRRHPAR